MWTLAVTLLIYITFVTLFTIENNNKKIKNEKAPVFVASGTELLQKLRQETDVSHT